MFSRRDLMKTALAGAVVGEDGVSSAPVLGLLGPVESAPPPEANMLYPTGVRFRAASVGLATMTPEGYDEVLDRLAPTAAELAREGAQAITLMGTSLSFYKGAAFNRGPPACRQGERPPGDDHEHGSDRRAAKRWW